MQALKNDDRIAQELLDSRCGQVAGSEMARPDFVIRLEGQIGIEWAECDHSLKRIRNVFSLEKYLETDYQT